MFQNRKIKITGLPKADVGLNVGPDPWVPLTQGNTLQGTPVNSSGQYNWTNFSNPSAFPTVVNNSVFSATANNNGITPDLQDTLNKMGANIVRKQKSGFYEATENKPSIRQYRTPGLSYGKTEPLTPPAKFNFGKDISAPLSEAFINFSNVARGIDDAKKQRAWNRQFRQQILPDNSAAPVPSATSGLHGNYAVTGTSYGKFRYPDMGFTNEGAYFNNPGLKVGSYAYGGVIDDQLELPADPIEVQPSIQYSPMVEIDGGVPEQPLTPQRQSGINPMAQKTWDEISQVFKGVSNYGIWGDKKHAKRVSDHNTGDALDIGITSTTQGNQVAQKLIAEQKERNIKYIIFNRRIWNPSEGWKTYTPNESNGNNPHTSHVHVSFSRDGLPKMASGGIIDEALELPSELISMDGMKPMSDNSTMAGGSESMTQPIDKGDFVLPVSNVRITSGFGSRNAPLKGASTNHNGIDIGVPLNTDVFSPMDGVVENVYYNSLGGKQLIIRHVDGSKSGFAHLNDYKVSKGDTVTKGQIVALSGNTGNSTGPHLHFTFRNSNGNLVDPADYFGLNGNNNQERVSNWEHYNPGNIHVGSFTKAYGAKVGRKDGNGNVAIFKNMNDGISALKNLIFGKTYIDLTVEQARNLWVNGDMNKFTESTPHIVNAVGSNKKLSDLNDDQKRILVNEFIKWEDRNVYNRLLKEKLIN